MSEHMGHSSACGVAASQNKKTHEQKLTGCTQECSTQPSVDLPSGCVQHAETRDRAGDLQNFGLTLSQLSYRP